MLEMGLEPMCCKNQGSAHAGNGFRADVLQKPRDCACVEMGLERMCCKNQGIAQAGEEFGAFGRQK